MFNVVVLELSAFDTDKKLPLSTPESRQDFVFSFPWKTGLTSFWVSQVGTGPSTQFHDEGPVKLEKPVLKYRKTVQ